MSVRFLSTYFGKLHSYVLCLQKWNLAKINKNECVIWRWKKSLSALLLIVFVWFGEKVLCIYIYIFCKQKLTRTSNRFGLFLSVSRSGDIISPVFDKFLNSSGQNSRFKNFTICSRVYKIITCRSLW